MLTLFALCSPLLNYHPKLNDSDMAEMLTMMLWDRINH
jgi:hypothetical protein